MSNEMHMIGNAHIDAVWLWRWPDGCAQVRSTFRSALERMKEYPDFVFTAASAAYYQWVEETDPDMFREIQARVREGRWRIVGGWWVQPDCNIPSGESLARQGLMGQRYFGEKFGVTAHTGYNVDSFGHSAMIPKIIKRQGMDNYVYMRPGWHEKSYPAWTFRWQSPEGESVKAFRVPFEYCTWGQELDDTVARVAHEMQNGQPMMCFYGDMSIVGPEVETPWTMMITAVNGGAGLLTLFGIVMGWTLIETATGCIHMIIDRADIALQEKGRAALDKKLRGIIAVLTLVAALIFSRIGVVDLIGAGYTYLSYGFIIFYLLPTLIIGGYKIIKHKDAA